MDITSPTAVQCYGRVPRADSLHRLESCAEIATTMLVDETGRRGAPMCQRCHKIFTTASMRCAHCGGNWFPSPEPFWAMYQTVDWSMDIGDLVLAAVEWKTPCACDDTWMQELQESPIA